MKSRPALFSDRGEIRVDADWLLLSLRRLCSVPFVCSQDISDVFTYFINMAEGQAMAIRWGLVFGGTRFVWEHFCSFL